MKTPDPFKTDPERNFPEDYQQENGNYMNKCVYCGNFFMGNKHRNSCKKCDNGSIEFFTAISKIKKPEDNKCAHAGCWSQGEMVGYAKCMLEKVFPASSQIEDLTKTKWIKSSDRMPEYNVSVMVFIPEEDNHITSGMWDISNKWVLLDEYRVPLSEVTYWAEMLPEPDDKTYKPLRVKDKDGIREEDTITYQMRELNKQVFDLTKEVERLKGLVKQLQDNTYEASQTIEEAKDLLNHFVFGDNMRHEAIKWIQEVEKKIIGE
jgi:hypothetical protein